MPDMKARYLKWGILTAAATLLTLAGCIVEKDSYNQNAAGAWLGQETPNSTPQLFAEGIVTTQHPERDAAFSPDGKEFYFTLNGAGYAAIMVVREVDGRWMGPEVASFSGRYADIEPFVTPDGNRLYFASKRPLDGVGAPKDYDIWYVQRTNLGWSEARNLGAPVNTAGDEFYPSVSRDGTLYLTAAYDDCLGQEDVYRATPGDGAFGAPENLGNAINGPGFEFNAMISPDGDYLIFTGYGREDGLGGGDLYISFRDEDGSWRPARNMGPDVNSDKLDYCPALAPGGGFFFFTSARSAAPAYSEQATSYHEQTRLMGRPGNGQDDIYWIDAGIIERLRNE